MAGGDVVDGQVRFLVDRVEAVVAQLLHLVHPHLAQPEHLDAQVVAEDLLVERVREQRQAQLVDGEPVQVVGQFALVQERHLPDVRYVDVHAAQHLVDQRDVVLAQVAPAHLVGVDRGEHAVAGPPVPAEVADPVRPGAVDQAAQRERLLDEDDLLPVRDLGQRPVRVDQLVPVDPVDPFGQRPGRVVEEARVGVPTAAAHGEQQLGRVQVRQRRPVRDRQRVRVRLDVDQPVEQFPVVGGSSPGEPYVRRRAARERGRPPVGGRVTAPVR